MIIIRCKRGGAKKNACYRIVASEKTTKRDGRAIEELGFYQPAARTAVTTKINLERIQHYLDCGADMSPTVKSLVKFAREQQVSV